MTGFTEGAYPASRPLLLWCLPLSLPLSQSSRPGSKRCSRKRWQRCGSKCWVVAALREWVAWLGSPQPQHHRLMPLGMW